MTNSVSLFNFVAHPEGSFPIPSSGVQLEVIPESGVLLVKGQGGEPASFPLIESGEPCEQALFISNTNGPALEVGTVGFGGAPEFLEDYPLNIGKGSKIEFTVKEDGGYIGCLDIRDIGRMAGTIFNFDLVPIKVSMTGGYLRISTVRNQNDNGSEAWYSQYTV